MDDLKNDTDLPDSQYDFLPNDKAVFEVVNVLVPKEQLKRVKIDYCDCYGRIKFLFDKGELYDVNKRKIENYDNLAIIAKGDDNYENLLKNDTNSKSDNTNQYQSGYFPYLRKKND